MRFANALCGERNSEAGAAGETTTKPPGPGAGSGATGRTGCARRLHIDGTPGPGPSGWMNHDRPSNTVVVDLEGDKAEQRPSCRPVYPPARPTVPARGNRTRKISRHCRAISRCPKAPRLPADSGVSFTTEFRVEKGRQSLNIFGAFAVQDRGFHLPPEIRLFASSWTSDGGKVAAVVPVTLAVLGLDSDGPCGSTGPFPFRRRPARGRHAGPGAASRSTRSAPAIRGRSDRGSTSVTSSWTAGSSVRILSKYRSRKRRRPAIQVFRTGPGRCPRCRRPGGGGIIRAPADASGFPGGGEGHPGRTSGVYGFRLRGDVPRRGGRSHRPQGRRFLVARPSGDVFVRSNSTRDPRILRYPGRGRSVGDRREVAAWNVHGFPLRGVRRPTPGAESRFGCIQPFLLGERGDDGATGGRRKVSAVH